MQTTKITAESLAAKITGKRIFTHPNFIANQFGITVEEARTALAELPGTITKVDADGETRYRIDPS